MHYRDIFPPHALLVVVHAQTFAQVKENVDIAMHYGADGVFLINHGPTHTELTSWYLKLRREIPAGWIGLNYLDLSQSQAIAELPHSASGLWVDDMGVRDDNEPTPNTLDNLRAHWWAAHPERLHFGGVAFKGQQLVKDPAKAARKAIRQTDVITTSGPQTGSPPALEKIVAMRRVIDDRILAVASGISHENVRQFKPYVDCFIVASGISEDYHQLDPKKVLRLAEIIHE